MGLNNFKRLFLVLSLLVLSVLSSLDCGNKADIRSTKSDPFTLDTVSVKTKVIQSGDMKLVKTFTGTLEGEEQANIVSKISERVTGIKVKVGARVKSGDLILTLDKAGVTSQYYQAKASFMNSEKEYYRMKDLYEAGAISQQMLDGSKTGYDIAKANFEAARSAVELTSPINGIVTAVNPNIGDLAIPGYPLVTIASINNMKVFFSAGEADIPNFAIGQAAEIFSELKPEVIRKGKVSQISKSADVQSRSFDIKAEFPNTNDLWFKPGMFCRVNIEMQKHDDVIKVPNEAIISSQNSTFVFVVDSGRAVLRNVKTGITDGNYTEIPSGLKVGETVVTLGMNRLKNGSIVRITD